MIDCYNTCSWKPREGDRTETGKKKSPAQVALMVWTNEARKLRDLEIKREVVRREQPHQIKVGQHSVVFFRDDAVRIMDQKKLFPGTRTIFQIFEPSTAEKLTRLDAEIHIQKRKVNTALITLDRSQRVLRRGMDEKDLENISLQDR